MSSLTDAPYSQHCLIVTSRGCTAKLGGLCQAKLLAEGPQEGIQKERVLAMQKRTCMGRVGFMVSAKAVIHDG